MSSDRKNVFERIVVENGCLVRLLRPVINDEFRLDAVADGCEVVVLDLDAVHRVTSFGVRAWVAALQTTSAKETLLVRCRPAIVLQFNAVEMFTRTVQLVSMYVPYLCRPCGSPLAALLDFRRRREIFPKLSPPAAHGLDDETAPRSLRGPSPPVHRCPACGRDAEFDDAPITYFSLREGVRAESARAAWLVATGRPAPRVSLTAGRLIDEASQVRASSGVQVEPHLKKLRDARESAAEAQSRLKKLLS